MDVEMGDMLAAAGARIGDDPVTVLHGALIAGDFTGGAEKPGDLLVGRLLRKIVERYISTLGDRQNMDRSSGFIGFKGKHVIVLVDLLAGPLAAQSLCEEVVGIVSDDGVLNSTV